MQKCHGSRTLQCTERFTMIQPSYKDISQPMGQLVYMYEDNNTMVYCNELYQRKYKECVIISIGKLIQ